MVTPRTCRLCSGRPLFESPRLCAAHLEGFDQSGEMRRVNGILRELEAGVITVREHDWRCNIAMEDYITRVLAERMHGGRS